MKKNALSDSYNALYTEEKISFVEMEVRFPRHRNEALVKLAGSGNRVLEIGCGNGNVLYNLRDRFKEIYGIELSSNRVDKLQKAAKSENLNLQVSAGNIEEGLNFSDVFFDVILWADVIEHVVDLWSAMAEINRLLIPGGRLVTCTPNIAEWRRRLTLLSGRFPATSGRDEGLKVRPGELFDGGHLHYFTFSSLANLYRKYNLEPVEYLGFGNWKYFHNFYPPLLSGSVCINGIKKLVT
jgi:SAM-dependent methyltransferase